MSKTKNYWTIVLICVAYAAFPQTAKSVAPVFVSKEKTRVHVDSIYRYQFVAIDSSGERIKYKVQNLPSWLKYIQSDHVITGRPLHAGQYPVTIVATNKKSKSSQHFMLTVFDDQTINILALGNSITNGTDIYNSYRRPLWKKLHRANYNFDFIGSWSGHHMGGKVPNPDFDMDHEGHSGWSYENLLVPPDWDVKRGNIQNWLQLYSPDVVLVELGTNDIFQCRLPEDIIKNLKSMIEVLRTKNPSVKIFIGSVIPLGPKWGDQNLCNSTYTYKELLTTVNKKISDFVNANSVAHSPLVVVDQFSAINPKQHLYDDIHPNTQGEEIMAETWFAAIRDQLRVLKR